MTSKNLAVFISGATRTKVAVPDGGLCAGPRWTTRRRTRSCRSPRRLRTLRETDGETPVFSLSPASSSLFLSLSLPYTQILLILTGRNETSQTYHRISPEFRGSPRHSQDNEFENFAEATATSLFKSKSPPSRFEKNVSSNENAFS